jgi:hypothetical protein
VGGGYSFLYGNSQHFVLLEAHDAPWDVQEAIPTSSRLHDLFPKGLLSAHDLLYSTTAYSMAAVADLFAVSSKESNFVGARPAHL